jgi:hypothetical protein
VANQVEGPPWPEAGGGVAGPVHNLLQERVLARRRQVWRARKLELVERAARLEQTLDAAGEGAAARRRRTAIRKHWRGSRC